MCGSSGIWHSGYSCMASNPHKQQAWHLRTGDSRFGKCFARGDQQCCDCRYRKFQVKEDVDLVVRCEIDGMMPYKGEDQLLSVKALNEFDSKTTGDACIAIQDPQAVCPATAPFTYSEVLSSCSPATPLDLRLKVCRMQTSGRACCDTFGCELASAVQHPFLTAPYALWLWSLWSTASVCVCIRRGLEAKAGDTAWRSACNRAEEQRQQAGQVDSCCPGRWN